jgi:hypothetical protein
LRDCPEGERERERQIRPEPDASTGLVVVDLRKYYTTLPKYSVASPSKLPGYVIKKRREAARLQGAI